MVNQAQSLQGGWDQRLVAFDLSSRSADDGFGASLGIARLYMNMDIASGLWI
jgi:hypothetical protein